MGRRRFARDGTSLKVVDTHVGGRVRIRRGSLGLTQTELATRLGVTFQQVQKYEGGANSLAASRLWQMARVLDVPVGFFFDAMPAALDGLTEAGNSGVPVPPLDRRETLDLLSCYYRVADPRLRQRVFDLVTTMVGALEEAVK